ncbi:MAG: nicotinate-nucleotide--dimethylbenzimidazole phosphoribosyltransferase, partial [Actinomycetota bacterium]
MTPTALETTLTAIRPADERARADARRLLDGKTKPRGSLGALEDLACRLAAIRGAIPPPPTPAVVVVAADHGVAREGVSAYPSEVTAQMLSNFASGGAAVAVLAARARARRGVGGAGGAANDGVP